MWRFTGVIGACTTGLVIWLIMRVASEGLPTELQMLLRWPLAAVAAFVGFLAGGTIARRARSTPAQIGLFSTLAGAIAGGIIGLVTAVGVTAAYLINYAGWPSTLMDQILMGLAYPAFGLVGCFVGVILGGLCGAAAGVMLRLTTPRFPRTSPLQ